MRSYISCILIILILNMFSHRLNSRLDMTTMQSNVLMAQIRAEKGQFLQENRTPTTITSHRESQGKKMFREMLYRPSLSPSQKENSPHNYFRANHRGRQFKPQQEGDRSRSGKKIARDKNNEEIRKNIIVEQKWQKRRFDYSPKHQHHNTNINFCWN